jgi:diguanylate cyclase (GGDEF)-like protein
VPLSEEGWGLAALASAEPVVVEDARTDPRAAAEGAALSRLLEECAAWIAVPLRAGGEVQGVVVLAWNGTAGLPAVEARALLLPLAGIVALAVHNARLYRLAALDEATSLPGATAFSSAVGRDVEAALSGGPAAVVLRFGLDGLDRVSARHGVEAGRALLRALADALRAAVPGRAQAGRVREDELALRLPGATREEARATAEAARARMAACSIRPDDGGAPSRVAVSVGIARCPDDATSVEFLLGAAERALAAARRAGGERVEDVHRVDALLVEAPPFEDGAIFRTERMVRVVETARRIARTDSTVLLTGETGTGKEVVADLIHRRSARAQGPLVKVNVAAFPETLLESELFGHERGAFTGADRRREGRFEVAHGGTIFLDEVGEMSVSAQAKLLRVLAEGQVTRLGGTRPVDVDVRVVAATNQDLEAAVASGRFREDLFYRLAVLRIELPPLRDRREEIPALVERFLADARERFGRGPRSLSPQAMDLLYRHSWPGNVRELKNVVDRLAVHCESDVAGPEDVRIDAPRAGASAAASLAAAPLDGLNERQRRLLDHLARNGRCTNREFNELTGASPRTGLRDLQDLIERGLIVREGKRRGAVYRLP